jgi:arylsulfatase A-like enzyme
MWGCREPVPLNVLLIVVDTLRFDHVGCYGHPRDTSPAIDRLASEGVRFERAYATAPWTKPSVASMITGLYPSAHGANLLESTVDESLRTLAEILRDRGYATGGVVSHAMLTTRRGFAQGFEIYREGDARGHRYVSTPGVTSKAIGLLDRFSQEERPFFLFVHYFDPHYSFVRHPGIGFAEADAGRLSGNETVHELRSMLHELTEDELRFLRDLYDEEIRFTDEGIDRLLAQVWELGLDANTLIVVTADHGEEFRERGWLGHTRSLYEELLRVPLIVRVPGAAARARTVSEPVSLVSLTPTILELIGIDPGDIRFQGESLAAQIQGGAAVRPGTIFAEVDYRAGDLELPIKRAQKKAIIKGRFKLIRDDSTGGIEVYDLERDAGEQKDLSGLHPRLKGELHHMLETTLQRVRKGAAEGGVRELSEEELEQLRGLGYLGS